MESIKLSEFKVACAEVIEKVHRTGEPVVITRSGEPLAEIVPPARPKPRRSLGSMRGSGRIVGDIISPVSDEADWDVLRS